MRAIVLALVATLFAFSAHAQTTTIRPDGFGGYNVYTPPQIGSGVVGGTTTTVRPDGFGGYNVHTQPPIGSGQIGGTTSHMRPDGFGGYTINRY